MITTLQIDVNDPILDTGLLGHLTFAVMPPGTNYVFDAFASDHLYKLRKLMERHETLFVSTLGFKNDTVELLDQLNVEIFDKERMARIFGSDFNPGKGKEKDFTYFLVRKKLLEKSFYNALIPEPNHLILTNAECVPKVSEGLACSGYPIEIKI